MGNVIYRPRYKKAEIEQKKPKGFGVKNQKKGVDEMKQTPLQAIKKFCFECSGRNSKAVAVCSNAKCPLYVYRNGKDPKLKKTLTEEEKAKLTERFKVPNGLGNF